MSAPVLVSPDYSKDLIIYSFASKDTIVGVLMQKDDEGNEKPMEFMSNSLRDVEVVEFL